jgi:energy-coupling factor transporter ATP-binding protein EcfA2
MTSISRMMIKGFRGVKSEVCIDLPSKSSLLLYGDNGTGKSTFLDAIEWFLTDQVSHLCGEEIETHGGLRYALNSDEDECSVEIHFANPTFKKKKALKQIKEKLKTEYVDELSESENLLLASISQNRAWIRNSDLIQFVLGTKSKRLSDISSIVGFEQVTDTKATLKKAANDIKGVIKSKNFPNVVASEQSTIAQNLGSLITNELQFVEAANEIIKPFVPTTQSLSLTDLEIAIQGIISKGSEADIKTATDLNEAIAASSQLRVSLENFKENYSVYISSRDALKADTERLNKLNEKNLLDYASKLLAHHKEDNCPLCLQVYSRDELKKQIVKRLDELKQIQDDFDALSVKSKNLSVTCSQIVGSIEEILKSSVHLVHEDAKKLIADLKSASSAISEFSQGLQLSVDQQTSVIPNQLDDVILKTSEKLEGLATLQLGQLNQNTSSQLAVAVSKLLVAVNAFRRIERLTAEQDILNSQSDTLGLIASEFTEVQRQEMTSLLSVISSSINEYYLFMNPSEKVDEIQLVCLNDKNGEFAGLAIHFSFHGKNVNSPKKFLSESHLNALGLCLFLSTVRAFNKSSNFIILDDVISSFDKAHRAMFARLLVEKFSDIQLLILTHESEWYEYLSSLVKGKPWRVFKSNWTSENGVVLSFTAGELRERIEKKINENDETDLGNLIRQYGERSLKEIAEYLGAPIAFKFNNRNEPRFCS